MKSEDINKEQIIKNICYTELVYGRINKKLGESYTEIQIERLMLTLLTESPVKDYVKTGKNYYISNHNHKIRVTVNSYTYRIITVDKII